MLPRALLLLCLAAIGSRAQESSSSSTSTSSSSGTSSSSTTVANNGFTFTNQGSVITTNIPTSAFTGSDITYLSPTGQSTVRTLTETITALNGSVATITTTSSVSTNTQITLQSSSVSLISIGGSNATATNATMTASSTSSAAQPTNTVPCNGFPEFCERQYSNITMVTAHNAAFDIRNNIASNQIFPIDVQLNDGVRMLSGEVHYVNNSLYNCHSDCSLLNTGPWESSLVTLREWVQAHPYDVVTVLIVNSQYAFVENFTAPIINAGLMPYVYTPAYVPQYRDQWPTLGEMILKNQRVVFFMDYQANQSSVPYILDEFTHMWETPFSPTDPAFPCDQQRPPNLDPAQARDRYMYLANHNLNTAVDLSSLGITVSEELLVPNTAAINNTNGLGNSTGELGAASRNCAQQWGRPPNFLLVDYYNYGSDGNGNPLPGSVFHVAAAANNVTYTQPCCGTTSGAPTEQASYIGLFVALAATVLLAW